MCRADGRRLARRLVQLYVGLWLYGFSSALQVRASLGLDPWDVLHQGVSRRTGVSIGAIVIAVGVVVLLLWIPLRERPGLGTVSNVVLVGVSLDVGLALLPEHPSIGVRVVEVAGGIALCALASGMYIGARFGPGPRDGLMTGLARRTGRSIRLVRTGLEVTVLVVGWLLGGDVGLGTVAFALAIGPLTQVFLPLFDTTARSAADGPASRRRPRGPARWRAARPESRTQGVGPRRSATGRPTIPD